MNKVIQYFKDSYDELIHHVTWTPFNELQNYTTIVLVALIMLTILVWIMDKVSELVIVTGIYGNI